MTASVKSPIGTPRWATETISFKAVLYISVSDEKKRTLFLSSERQQYYVLLLRHLQMMCVTGVVGSNLPRGRTAWFVPVYWPRPFEAHTVPNLRAAILVWFFLFLEERHSQALCEGLSCCPFFHSSKASQVGSAQCFICLCKSLLIYCIKFVIKLIIMLPFSWVCGKY